MIGLFYILKGADRVLNSFRAAEGQFPRFMLTQLERFLISIVREAKKNLTGGKPLNVVEDRLRQSVIHQIIKKGGSFGQRIYEGSVGTNVIYGAVHETGKTIHAKKDYMKFWYKGRYYQVRKVVIPKREWLGPAFRNAQKRGKAEWSLGLDRFVRMRGL